MNADSVKVWGRIPVLVLMVVAVLGTMGRFELEVLYARAKTKVWEKVETLRIWHGRGIKSSRALPGICQVPLPDHPRRIAR